MLPDRTITARLFSLALTLLAALHPAAINAQPLVSVRGTVQDQSGGVVPSARVTATPEGSSQIFSATTDQRGEFVLPLAPGRYVLLVGSNGFLDITDTLVVSIGSTLPRRFTLQVAGIQDSVSVTAAPSGYSVSSISSATKTPTPLRDVPQSITVVTKQLMRDQLMTSVADVVRYVPGVVSHQGENNRDQLIIRGQSTSADFFINGVRDDVQYYRDLYNLDRIEALKGPNAMVFGRGGGGGVINRVTKDAIFQPVREVVLQGGSYGNRRFTTDLGGSASNVAFRLNGMYENSDSFRDNVNLERYGVSPSLTFAATDRTTVKVGYEYLHDGRVADRGISSYHGAPADVPLSTYYGDPSNSHVRADVNIGSATIEHRAGSVLIRNHTLFGAYDRGYENYVPGVVTPDKSQMALSAYNNATNRNNVFNQTDVTLTTSTGSVRHTLLAGAEIGRQSTDNFRNTGYFNNTLTSILVSYANPVVATPVTFRQSLTDADNHVLTSVAAAYAQDQVELSKHFQVIGGLRFDRFDVDYHNNRNQDDRGRTDDLVSPRAGLVFKPITPLSFYSSYTVSYLPASGDQFSSLTVVTEQLKPEKFTNYEVGVKWDLIHDFSLTTAVYRLDRTNTRSTDPTDPTRIVQTGSQRTNGYELGLNGHIVGSWSVVGGYAYQDAYVTSATAAAKAGAQVAQVPRHMLSLWNYYQLHPRVGAGLGIIGRTDVFAAIDNTVTLPGYTRADAAAYFTMTKDLRLQLNVENLFDRRYYVNADSNTNISPGYPRAVRVGLTAVF